MAARTFAEPPVAGVDVGLQVGAEECVAHLVRVVQQVVDDRDDPYLFRGEPDRECSGEVSIHGLLAGNPW